MQPPARPRLADEEYVLPTVEALFAGTLALMTGCAQHQGDGDMRELMAGKVVSNLLRLSEHPELSPPMRMMLTQLSQRWSGPGSSAGVWMEAPAALQ
jgi:hypothetical protein